MTLSSLTTNTSFNGDGSTVDFTTSFIFWNSSDLRVILVSSSGSETVWTEGTQYSVTGGDGATGIVSASTGPTDYTPASGYRLLVKSNVALLQPTNLPVGGSFNSEDVEAEIDRTVRRLQQLDEITDRGAFLAEASTVAGPFTIPTPSSGLLLGWSTDADFTNYTPNSSTYINTATMAADYDLLSQGVHTVFIPAGSFTARATQGAASNTVELTTNDVMIKTYDFTASSSVPEAIQFMMAMPKSWDEGTLTGEHYWTCTSSSQTGDVVWGVRGISFANDDAMDASWGTAQTVADTFITKHDMHISSAFSAVTLAGTPSTDEMVVLEVYRDSGSTGDTLGVDASYLGLRLKMTVDAPNDA